MSSVLHAGEALRAARERALVGDCFPEPEHDERFHACRLELDQAVEGLETAAALGDEGRAVEAVGRWLAAILELRAAGHAFAPTRQSSSSAARVELFATIEAFGHAFEDLKHAADASHVPHVPWRIAFSSHVAPHVPMSSLELTGYDLPSVPVASLSWGERCFLTGRGFHTDSNRRPAIRYRSLDSCNTVLDPTAYEVVVRSRRALSSLGSVCREKIEQVVAALPQLFEHFVEEDCSNTFAKLGLSEFPSLAVVLNNALVRFAHRPLFGAHGVQGGFEDLGGRNRSAAVLREGPRKEGFRWLSSGEVRHRALRLAFGLESLGLENGVRIGVFSGRNAQESYLTDFACVFSNLVSVGLHDGLADDALADILHATAPAAVFCSSEAARRLVRCGLGKEVLLVLTDGTPESTARAFPTHRCIRAADLVATGNKMPHSWTSPSGVRLTTGLIYDDEPGWEAARRHGISPDGDEDLYTVIFTSGSTGSPKGYPVTRGRWREGMEYRANLWPYVVVSYQPFALAADRKAVWQVVLNGGRVGFARSGSLLFDDIREVRPTYFEGPPAIWNIVTGEYGKEMSRAGTDPKARAHAILRLQELMGGRLAAMAVGGAPSDQGMRSTLEGLFGLRMGEGYGTTETGTIAESGRLLAHLDYRVLDVPELGLASDDRPFPRGELVVRPSTGLGEYLAGDGSTEDRFTGDGYFRTGDLIEVRPDGSYRFLGRRAEALKLAGGEFVPPARLEELLRLSPLIR
ncbi:MAG: AMP-binding protein, partial [Acidobacteriota bacterium]